MLEEVYKLHEAFLVLARPLPSVDGYEVAQVIPAFELLVAHLEVVKILHVHVLSVHANWQTRNQHSAHRLIF